MLSRLSRLRLDWIAAVVVLVVTALQIDPLPVGVMRDDAMYVVLAKSLATGHGYRWINLPGAPVATHFPPGYPALLALIWWLVPAFPANVFAFKAINALLTAVVTFGTARFAMARFAMSCGTAAVVGIAAALSVPMISLGIRVMSEPLFLAMAIAALLVAERVVDGDDRWHAAVLAGALAGAATLVRSFGIALLGAVVLALLLRRRVRAASIAFASSMVFVLPWQLFVSGHQGVVPQPMRGNYESYTAWFAAALRDGGPALLVRTVANNARGVGNVLAGTFGWSLPHGVWNLVLVATLVLLILGGRVLWTHARATALFLGAYSAILLTWPYFGARYIWGAWPLVILTVALGVREVYTRRPSASAVGIGHRCAQGVLAAGVVMYAVGAWQAAHEHVWSVVASAQAAPIRNVVRWINDRTPGDAIVAANYEGAVYLYTDRLTVPVNSLRPETVRPRTTEESAQTLGEIVRAYRVTTVALTVPWLIDAADVLSAQTPPALVPLERFDGGEAFTPTGSVPGSPSPRAQASFTRHLRSDGRSQRPCDRHRCDGLRRHRRRKSQLHDDGAFSATRLAGPVEIRPTRPGWLGGLGHPASCRPARSQPVSRPAANPTASAVATAAIGRSRAAVITRSRAWSAAFVNRSNRCSTDSAVRLALSSAFALLSNV